MIKSCKCPIRYICYISAPLPTFYSTRKAKPLQILSKELLAFIKKYENVIHNNKQIQTTNIKSKTLKSRLIFKTIELYQEKTTYN